MRRQPQDKDKDKKPKEEVWGGDFPQEQDQQSFDEPFEESDKFSPTTDPYGEANKDSSTATTSTSSSSWDLEDPKVDPGEDDLAESEDPWKGGKKGAKKPSVAAGGSQRSVPDLSAAILCPALAIANGIRGGAVGGVLGVFGGLSQGMSAGLSGRDLAAVVFQSTKSSAGSFALWLGTYSGTKCALQSARNRRDVLNSFGAGFVAGTVGTIRSGNIRYVLMSGAASGVLMAVLESF